VVSVRIIPGWLKLYRSETEYGHGIVARRVPLVRQTSPCEALYREWEDPFHKTGLPRYLIMRESGTCTVSIIDVLYDEVAMSGLSCTEALELIS
jgi:hypothetical protein